MYRNFVLMASSGYISELAQLTRCNTAPLAVAFIAEAFFVMGILAYYFAKILSEKKWLVFIALSLIGGLGFSIPVFLVTNGSNETTR